MAFTITYPFISILGIYRPIIPVKIENPAIKFSIVRMALLDTGADHCVFPAYVAQGTGHTLKAAKVICKSTTGVAGVAVPTWCHTFEISLLDKDRKTEIWKSNSLLIQCLEQDKAPILLGMGDFLNNFIITFDYTKREVTISSP